MSRDGNIWLGRAHGLTLKNQMLMIYGYVERYPKITVTGNYSALQIANVASKPPTNDFFSFIGESTQDDEFDHDLRFFGKLRGKNANDEDWTIIQSMTEESRAPLRCKKVTETANGI